jgi:hypothetical protein
MHVLLIDSCIGSLGCVAKGAQVHSSRAARRVKRFIRDRHGGCTQPAAYRAYSYHADLLKERPSKIITGIFLAISPILPSLNINH